MGHGVTNIAQGNPVVSVVIPTYNRAPLVGRAVDSALGQQFPNLEVVVVDDGSTDDTRTNLARFEDRIQYYRQVNRGVSAARNAGIRQSRGDIIAFLDSDDMWQPQYLSTQVALLAQFPEAVGSMMNCVFKESDGRDVNWFDHTGLSSVLPGRGTPHFVARPFWTVAAYRVTVLDACVFRRTALLSRRWFDETITIGEDWDFVANMALSGPFVFSRQVGAWAFRSAGDAEGLSGQFWSAGIRTRRAWERIYSGLLRQPSLESREVDWLRRKYASNQRALGNLYLRTGDSKSARAEYLKAFRQDRSISSMGRVLVSYLPATISRMTVAGERQIDPGVEVASAIDQKTDTGT